MSLRRRFIVPILGLALIACDGTLNLQPKPLTSRVYQLVAVSGHALPVDVFSGPVETNTALGGTLTLFSSIFSDTAVTLTQELSPDYPVYKYRLTP